MNGLLVRVAADQSSEGGFWNGPVNSLTRDFVYVPIPESSATLPGLNKPYAGFTPALRSFGHGLPPHLAGQDMHLDPDFSHLTYGDRGQRGAQIQANVAPGDLLAFYAGMRDVLTPNKLVYALIGLYVIDAIVPAVSVPVRRRDENAHTRRVLTVDALDIVVRARPTLSGRLERCIPIGDFRSNAYRVSPQLLTVWGGLNVKDGYIQRSVRLPRFTNASNFYRWFCSQGVPLIPRNN